MLTLKQLAKALLDEPEEVQNSTLYFGERPVMSYEILTVAPKAGTGVTLVLSTKDTE